MRAATHLKCSGAVVANVAKALPWNLRHIEQWQCAMVSIGPSMAKAMSPQRQLPVSMSADKGTGIFDEVVGTQGADDDAADAGVVRHSIQAGGLGSAAVERFLD